MLSIPRTFPFPRITPALNFLVGFHFSLRPKIIVLKSLERTIVTKEDLIVTIMDNLEQDDHQY